MTLTEKIKSRPIKSEIVEVDGLRFCITGKSLRERSEIFAAVEKRKQNLNPACLAACVTDPDDGSAATYDEWNEAPSHITGPLISVVMSVCGMDKDDLTRDPKDSSAIEN